MQRRAFLKNASLALGSGILPASALTPAALGASSPTPPPPASGVSPAGLGRADWSGLREMFALDPEQVHLATFFLSSHPRPVAEAIARHREGFDRNPVEYTYMVGDEMDRAIPAAAAAYMGGRPDQIAITGSTTMGLALIASGLMLGPDDEILHSEHDHYAMDRSFQLRAERTGARVRRIPLYEAPSEVSVDQVLTRIRSAITPATKLVAMTWVHSSSGVKLPIEAIAGLLAELNQARDEADHILFLVDGVHGIGVEDVDISRVGCDFFIAGTHKWLFGPRGTGVIWGSDRGWARCKAVIPSFSSASYGVWLGSVSADQVTMGEHMTPGGFHAFDHQWALPEAFNLHLELGKSNVQERIHALNTLTKEGLREIPGVTLHTPMSPALSAGLICYDYKDLDPMEVVMGLYARGIISSGTPYRRTYARLAPSLLNNEEEIERTLATLSQL